MDIIYQKYTHNRDKDNLFIPVPIVTKATSTYLQSLAGETTTLMNNTH